MKKKVFGVVVLALGVAFLNIEAKADNLLGDIDGGIFSDTSSFWLGTDTNPDFVSPNSEAVEEQWLEALLQKDVIFVDRHEEDGLGDYEGLKFWTTPYDPGFKWDYVIAKTGKKEGPSGDLDPTIVFSHYAFGDNDLDDNLFSLPAEFSFVQGLSHLTFFKGTPDNPPTIPEPATMLLFGTGLAALAGIRRKRKI